MAGNPNLPSWARGTTSSGGPKNPNLPSWAQPTAPVVAAPKKTGHSGLFGGILHTVAKDTGLKAVGHVAEKTATGLAEDAWNTPGGLYELGGQFLHNDVSAGRRALHGDVPGALLQVGPDAQNPVIQGVARGTIKSAVESVEHPLRHPDQTLLNATAALSAAGGVAARAGAAADAARAGGDVGDVAKAFVRKPVAAPRLIRVGDEEAPVKGALTKTPLTVSKNPAVRVVQKAHDTVIQKAIDKNPDSKLASYGTKRVGGSLDETRRYQTAMRSAPANVLEKTGKDLGRGQEGKINQAALRLTSHNALPDERIAFHQAQIEKGVGDAANHEQQIKLLQAVKDRGMVKDVAGHTVIDAAKFPKLDAVDQRIATGSAERDKTLIDTGQMTAEGIKARIDAPNRIVAGGKYDDEAGKIVGGDSARPGRNYVPDATYEAKPAGESAVGRTPGPVVGKTKGIISATKVYKGGNLEKGLVPDNTSALVARKMREAYKFASTEQFRREVPGSLTRQSSRDVLVNTQELKNAKVPDSVYETLGKKVSTLDELDDLAGHKTAFDAFRARIIPSLGDPRMADVEARKPLGEKAPEGFKWVDRNVLGELGRPLKIGPKSRIARAADNVNSAITGATVYFKPGHVFTRGFTNAATNIIQGSATPVGIGDSLKLFHELTPEERQQAFAAVGESGISSLPSEAQNKLGALTRWGQGKYAKLIDSPFRFNSLAYEARKAGIDTPEKFRTMLKQMKNPEGLSDADRAKIDQIAKRANREAIAYDRLGETEKNVIRRVFWFYNWLKGATVFGKDTLLEHPYKAAALGGVGQQGARQAQKEFGLLPSYDQGLFKVGGTKGQPWTVNPGTLSPFSTPAEIISDVAHLNKPTQAEQISSFLNPTLGSAAAAAFHLNSYGEQSKTGMLSDLVSNLGSSTPEAAMLAAFRAKPGSQRKRMFPASNESAIAKFFLGSAVPRKMNAAVARKDAGFELKDAGRKH